MIARACAFRRPRGSRIVGDRGPSPACPPHGLGITGTDAAAGVFDWLDAPPRDKNVERLKQHQGPALPHHDPDQPLVAHVPLDRLRVARPQGAIETRASGRVPDATPLAVAADSRAVKNEVNRPKRRKHESALKRSAAASRSLSRVLAGCIACNHAPPPSRPRSACPRTPLHSPRRVQFGASAQTFDRPLPPADLHIDARDGDHVSRAANRKPSRLVPPARRGPRQLEHAALVAAGPPLRHDPPAQSRAT